jgi:Peptidase M15
MMHSGKVARAGAAIAAISMLISACATRPVQHGSTNGASIVWNDTAWCVPFRLRRALADVSRRFGPVTVHSTHRWPIENWLKGGKSKSYHLSCRAVDFSVPGDPAAVTAYLVSLSEVGGYSHYDQGFYHIDTGPRRTW